VGPVIRPTDLKRGLVGRMRRLTRARNFTKTRAVKPFEQERNNMTYTVVIRDASGAEVNKFQNVTKAQYEEILKVFGA
jgi:hypothetical protein